MSKSLKLVTIMTIVIITLISSLTIVSAKPFSTTFDFNESSVIALNDADEVYEITGVGNSEKYDVIGHIRLKYDSYSTDAKYAELKVSYVLKDGVTVRNLHTNVDFDQGGNKVVNVHFNEPQQFVTFVFPRNDKNQYSPKNKVVGSQDTSKYYYSSTVEEVKEFSYVSSPETEVYLVENNVADWKGATVIPEEDFHPKWVEKNFVSTFGINPDDAKPVWKYQYSNITGPSEFGANNELPVLGEVASFRRFLDLSSVKELTKAELKINADNAYTVAFNNPPEAEEAFKSGFIQDIEEFTIADLVVKGGKNDMVDSWAWNNGYTLYDNDTDLLNQLNLSMNDNNQFYLYFLVANEFFDVGDYPNTTTGNYLNNPAALVFELYIEGIIEIPVEEMIQVTYAKQTQPSPL